VLDPKFEEQPVSPEAAAQLRAAGLRQRKQNETINEDGISEFINFLRKSGGFAIW
jgi:hypothetical protein